MIRYTAPLLLLLPLAACGTDDTESGNATTFSISARSENGNTTITGDGGKVGIKVPGFEGTVAIPGFRMKSDDFDLDGVKLYPDTAITHFGVQSDERDGDDHGRVVVEFESPAARDKVVAWFRDKFEDKDFQFSETRTGFTGATEDGDPFTLNLTADGSDKTQGKITIGK
ncbi:hypothetical protein [Sphingosinithalassobacter portus]|uniref:hypothetical protein n=1 Tax=Stakelama portus TaxID=2676234 RepID=UPI0011AB483C|nr:hypothetical protein [Sphingosinithalassobacter portus]